MGGQIQLGYVIRHPFGGIIKHGFVDVIDDELIGDDDIKAANPSFNASAGPDIDETGRPEVINHILG